jgi:hypothetical protein
MIQWIFQGISSRTNLALKSIALAEVIQRAYHNLLGLLINGLTSQPQHSNDTEEG